MIRATFEARGYTAWDPTSPAFLVYNDGVNTIVHMALTFGGDIGIDNAGGTLAPAGYAVVGLAIDAVGLAEGNHVFNLTLASNDPDNPTITVPIRPSSTLRTIDCPVSADSA